MPPIVAKTRQYALNCVNNMINECTFTATVRKTITLTEQQDNWIKSQIGAGHYTNDSEFIRDLVRRDQERVAQIDAVRAALIAGENSGEPKAFIPSAYKQRMHAQYG